MTDGSPTQKKPFGICPDLQINSSRGLKKEQSKTKSSFPQIYILEHLAIVKAMATFLSLPLELRNQIYDYALSDGHDIITDGMPALYKIHPAITRELYSYRDLIITIPITQELPFNLRESPPQPLLQSRILDLAATFKSKKEQKRRLVVVFEAVVQGIRLTSDDGDDDKDALSKLLAKIGAIWTDVLTWACEKPTTAAWESPKMVATMAWEDVLTAAKAEIWTARMRAKGVDARFASRAIVSRRDVRTALERLIRSPVSV